MPSSPHSLEVHMVDDHYTATIIMSLALIGFMGGAQRLVAAYYRKLTPDEYIWWWRVTLALEGLIYVVGIWPIGLLSLLICFALYARLNVEMKFYREHYLRHPIVDFGFQPDRPPTYKPLAKPVRILMAAAIVFRFCLAFLNLWLHR
jgi:hypothetical protein